MNPIILATTLLVILANILEVRPDDVLCYFCQDSACLKNKPHKIMNCSQDKMSSMNLTGEAKQTWDLLSAESTDESEICVQLKWDYGTKRHWYLSGCAPRKVGEEYYCNFVDAMVWKNHYNFTIECEDCAAHGNYCLNYPVFSRHKNCLLCETRNCREYLELDCTEAKMSSYNWTTNLEMWDLLLAGGTELDDPTEYTNCVHLDWKNGIGSRSDFWGCAPDMVGKEEYCDYVNKTSMKNNYTLVECDTCEASYFSCISRDADRKKKAQCYMSQDPDKLDALQIMDCKKETMDLIDLTEDADKMWHLLATTRPGLDDPERNDRCFAMFWDHDGGSGFLTGCAPAMVGLLKFCDYVNETAAKNNYTVASCQTAIAVEEPSLYKTWPNRKCYMCEGSECSEPSKILDCNQEEMHFSNLDKLYFLWRSEDSSIDEIENISYYNQCYGMMYKNDIQWGCAPEYVHNVSFCNYIQNQATKKLYDSNLLCHTCAATETPCLDYQSWTAQKSRTKEKSSAMILYDHDVFCLIISFVFLKMML